MAKEGDEAIRKALAVALGEGCPETDVIAYPDFWNRTAGGGVEASSLLVGLFIDYLGAAIRVSLFKGGDVALENFGVFFMARTDARMGGGTHAGVMLDGRWRACFQRSEIGWTNLGPVEDADEGSGLP